MFIILAIITQWSYSWSFLNYCHIIHCQNILIRWDAAKPYRKGFLLNWWKGMPAFERAATASTWTNIKEVHLELQSCLHHTPLRLRLINLVMKLLNAAYVKNILWYGLVSGRGAPTSKERLIEIRVWGLRLTYNYSCSLVHSRDNFLWRRKF